MAKRISTPPEEAVEALRTVKAELSERKQSSADLAKHLGITRQAVSGWRAIPAEWVKRIAELTGIPPHRLRPDLYDEPPPPKERRPAAVG
jgi:DNA-binding transcriptional regulator YdaS (Cro superfamily)